MVTIIIKTANESGDRMAVTPSGKVVGRMKRGYTWRGTQRHYAIAGLGGNLVEIGAVPTKQKAAQVIGEFFDEQVRLLATVDQKIKEVSDAQELLHHAPTAFSLLDEGLNRLHLKRGQYQYFADLIKDEEETSNEN